MARVLQQHDYTNVFFSDHELGLTLLHNPPEMQISNRTVLITDGQFSVDISKQNRQNWANAMTDCLPDIKEAIDQARPIADHLTKAQLQVFEARYQNILDDGYSANPLSACPAHAGKKRGRRKKTKPRNLLEHHDGHRQEALAFMYDFNVPFDNNLAEWDIRMMKVQQKISGLFRSTEGARAFCRIHSYISTARKNALGALDAIARAFAVNPFVPVANTK